MITSNHALAKFGKKPNHIPHWEHWSNPDAESFITGIDYYQAPRSCRLRMNELYPDLGLGVHAADVPIPRPEARFADGADEEAHVVRWGEANTVTFEHGEALFADEEAVFAFSPLAQGDFRQFPVVEELDFRDEANLYEQLLDRHHLRGITVRDPESTEMPWFYNSMFMWPLLTFGWENFLCACLDERFERIMDEFAELNRRAFRCFARMPVNFVLCHDDICTSRGPVCGREWMNRYIYPRYEEFWGMLRDAGKRVIFIGDGNIDDCVDDLVACGVDGIISEPYTDFKRIVKRHPGLLLGGEGDNRILSGGDADAVRRMVDGMLETARECPRYFFCVGNHIPWNVPPPMVKLYLDLCRDLG